MPYKALYELFIPNNVVAYLKIILISTKKHIHPPLMPIKASPTILEDLNKII